MTRRYTSADWDYLDRAYSEGVALEIIAATLGRTTKAIAGQADIRGLARPDWFLAQCKIRSWQPPARDDIQPREEKPQWHLMTEAEIDEIYRLNGGYEDSPRAQANFGSMERLYRPEPYISAASSLDGMGTIHRARRAG